MQCQKEENKKNCKCTYEPCQRKGICCQCIKYHLKNRELPACCFNKESEKTYDRSFEHFAKLVKEKII